MRIIYLLILPLLLTFNVSGQYVKTKPPYGIKKMPYIEPELKSLVIEYLWDMHSNGIDIKGIEKIDSIIFVSDKMVICGDSVTVVGCALDNKIKLKKPTQYYLNPTAFKAVFLYHELGHGVLKMPHDFQHNSLMNPTLNEPILYIINWNYYHHMYISYYRFIKQYNLFLK